MNESRETFRSFGGSVFAMAGAAIGLGNIWRFPYMMGAFGGGLFLIVYIACVLTLGIPALMCEWTLGRRTRRGPVGAFTLAGMPGGRYWGGLFALAIFMGASYYVVVIGWVARYALVFLSHAELGSSPAAEFQTFTGSVLAQFVAVWPCLLLSCTALYFGVRGGIERVSRIIAPAVIIILLVLAVRVLLLDSAWERTLHYLSRTGGFGPRTILAALGQSLFSLALGGASMVTYGSYLRDEHSIARTAAWTAGLDTAGSLLAALAIIPPALVFGADLASGPALLFEVIPSLFATIPAGSLLAAVLLLAVWLCAMLSLMAAHEVIVAAMQDALRWSRRRALVVLLLSQSVLIIPGLTSIDYIFLSDLFWGSTMQPLGAAASVIAVVWYLRAAVSWPGWLRRWTAIAVPPAIILGLVYGWFA